MQSLHPFRTLHGSAGPQSVGRVFSILDFLVANSDGATLSELAAFSDAPKTSLVGLLNAMVAEGCLRREASGRYVLGPRVHGLAMRTVAGRELPLLARPFLVELVRATGETAVLGVLAPDADLVLYLDRVESANPIRYAVAVGERRELHCTALGKLILAYFSADSLDRYFTMQPLQKFTESTITSASALKTELKRIRQQGMARTRAERVNDANGLAAPVFTSEGMMAAGLLVAGPSPRMRANQEANEAHLRKAAAALTELLGGVPSPEQNGDND